MRAVRMHTFGGPDVLIMDNVERPKPMAGDVLIRVYAAGVNPVDWKIREGYRKDALKNKLPIVPGWDVAGVIEEVGPQTDRFQPGDAVFGRLDMLRNGAYADYTISNADILAPKPKNVDYIHAAALPIASLTAWQALFDVAQLQPGQKILIHAASGGVGHMAVQFAKWKGAHVIGTASAHNIDFLLELGADEVIDYNAVHFEDVVCNCDVVLDPLGGGVRDRSWRVLKKGGILVCLVGEPPADHAAQFGVRATSMMAHANADQLMKIGELVDTGKVNVVIDTVLPLSEVRRAHEISQSGHVRGKIVLEVSKTEQ
jgi:NADPH:quinone reductase-like Zn-dependent oxidoreductase